MPSAACAAEPLPPLYPNPFTGTDGGAAAPAATRTPEEHFVRLLDTRHEAAVAVSVFEASGVGAVEAWRQRCAKACGGECAADDDDGEEEEHEEQVAEAKQKMRHAQVSREPPTASEQPAMRASSSGAAAEGAARASAGSGTRGPCASAPAEPPAALTEPAVPAAPASPTLGCARRYEARPSTSAPTDVASAPASSKSGATTVAAGRGLAVPASVSPAQSHLPLRTTRGMELARHVTVVPAHEVQRLQARQAAEAARQEQLHAEAAAMQQEQEERRQSKRRKIYEENRDKACGQDQYKCPQFMNLYEDKACNRLTCGGCKSMFCIVCGKPATASCACIVAAWAR